MAIYADDTRPFLFADFQNGDRQGRIRFTNGTVADVKKLGINLASGLEIIMDDRDEFVAEGIVEFSDEEKDWVMKYDTLIRRSTLINRFDHFTLWADFSPEVKKGTRGEVVEILEDEKYLVQFMGKNGNVIKYRDIDTMVIPVHVISLPTIRNGR